jgi:hypothetical protein
VFNSFDGKINSVGYSISYTSFPTGVPQNIVRDSARNLGKRTTGIKMQRKIPNTLSNFEEIFVRQLKILGTENNVTN